MKNVDIAIIGGGPAGMAAAIKARQEGIDKILILERSEGLGGILQQCIHNGFGLHKFNEELTGPEYAYRYEKIVKDNKIPYMLDTMVLDISKDKIITATNSKKGIFQIRAKSIILAMGCRERSKGALNIAGDRPSGIYSAGTAQKFVNINGYLPGKNVVILGSGDIGLIMARRMTLEGANVKAVCEIMPYSGGLARNIQQCLKDFDIPLKLSHTVIRTYGKERLEGVMIAKVDENRKPIVSTCEFISCDTLLLSVGLIPENELSKNADIKLSSITSGAIVDQDRQTSVDGIFACGNVLHVHDLVDYVSEEAEIAGKSAADYVKNGNNDEKVKIEVITDGKVRYTVPQFITKKDDTKIYFRVSNVFKNVKINIKSDDKIKAIKKQKLVPGEMETITVSKEFLNSDKLFIELEEC